MFLHRVGSQCTCKSKNYSLHSSIFLHVDVLFYFRFSSPRSAIDTLNFSLLMHCLSFFHRFFRVKKKNDKSKEGRFKTSFYIFLDVSASTKYRIMNRILLQLKTLKHDFIARYSVSKIQALHTFARFKIHMVLQQRVRIHIEKYSDRI